MTPFDRSIIELMGEGWGRLLLPEFHKPYMTKLMGTLQAERQRFEVYPESGSVFRAFELTPLESVRVVVLGQDPYHTPGMATGLAFSVPEGTMKVPPSLENIFKELEDDMGWDGSPVQNPDLTRWAKQGVLLLNTCLTVRKGQPDSHHGLGWETFTSAVISVLDERAEPLIFVLWGRKAQAYSSLINPLGHWMIQSPHPSPFSAHTGFFGSRPFSRINKYLEKEYGRGIDWYESRDQEGVVGSAPERRVPAGEGSTAH